MVWFATKHSMAPSWFRFVQAATTSFFVLTATFALLPDSQRLHWHDASPFSIPFFLSPGRIPAFARSGGFSAFAQLRYRTRTARRSFAPAGYCAILTCMAGTLQSTDHWLPFCRIALRDYRHMDGRALPTIIATPLYYIPTFPPPTCRTLFHPRCKPLPSALLSHRHDAHLIRTPEGAF